MSPHKVDIKSVEKFSDFPGGLGDEELGKKYFLDLFLQVRRAGIHPSMNFRLMSWKAHSKSHSEALSTNCGGLRDAFCPRAILGGESKRRSHWHCTLQRVIKVLSRDWAGVNSVYTELRLRLCRIKDRVQRMPRIDDSLCVAAEGASVSFDVVPLSNENAVDLYGLNAWANRSPTSNFRLRCAETGGAKGAAFHALRLSLSLKRVE